MGGPMKHFVTRCWLPALLAILVQGCGGDGGRGPAVYGGQPAQDPEASFGWTSLKHVGGADLHNHPIPRPPVEPRKLPFTGQVPPGRGGLPALPPVVSPSDPSIDAQLLVVAADGSEPGLTAIQQV